MLPSLPLGPGRCAVEQRRHAGRGVFDVDCRPIPDATAEVVWLDGSTLVMAAEIPDLDITVTNSSIELSVRRMDADGATADNFGDTALGSWSPDPGSCIDQTPDCLRA